MDKYPAAGSDGSSGRKPARNTSRPVGPIRRRRRPGIACAEGRWKTPGGHFRCCAPPAIDEIREFQAKHSVSGCAPLFAAGRGCSLCESGALRLLLLRKRPGNLLARAGRHPAGDSGLPPGNGMMESVAIELPRSFRGPSGRSAAMASRNPRRSSIRASHNPRRSDIRAWLPRARRRDKPGMSGDGRTRRRSTRTFAKRAAAARRVCRLSAAGRRVEGRNRDGWPSGRRRRS